MSFYGSYEDYFNIKPLIWDSEIILERNRAFYRCWQKFRVENHQRIVSMPDFRDLMEGFGMTAMAKVIDNGAEFQILHLSSDLAQVLDEVRPGSLTSDFPDVPFRRRTDFIYTSVVRYKIAYLNQPMKAIHADQPETVFESVTVPVFTQDHEVSHVIGRIEALPPDLWK